MRKLVILILLASIAGLGLFQYRLLRISLQLAELRFDEKMGNLMRGLEKDLSLRNELTYLVGAALRDDSTAFALPLSHLRDTARYFLQDYLRHRLELEGIHTAFSFRIFDGQGKTLLGLPPAAHAQQRMYRANLNGYLNTATQERVVLQLNLLHTHRYLLLRFNRFSIPSLLFLLLALVCAVWLVLFLSRQSSLNATTRSFINNLTHELKTPVFSIGIAARLLQEKTQDPALLQLISMIRADNDRLKTHIERVLSLAQMERKKQVVAFQILDIQPLMCELADRWKEKTALAGGNFRAQIPKAPVWAEADPGHLLNALENLLDNALKYSGKVPEIEFKVFQKADLIVLSVTDKGPGIDPKFQRKVFEAFYRIPEAGELHQVKGFGLGLSYVKAVAVAHRGRVRLESRPGAGSSFSIEIPATRAPAQAPSPLLQP